MRNARTRFIAEERRLVIGGLPKHRDPSADLLLDLFGNGVLEDSHIRDCGRSQSLTLVLAEHEGLPPNNLLCRIAYRLSRYQQHLAVYDPWTIGGRPVDIELAADLIGDVFRRTTIPRLPVTSRR